MDALDPSVVSPVALGVVPSESSVLDAESSLPWSLELAASNSVDDSCRALLASVVTSDSLGVIWMLEFRTSEFDSSDVLSESMESSSPSVTAATSAESLGLDSPSVTAATDCVWS